MSRARLEVLLTAYAAERADDSQSVSTYFALLTAAIGLVSLIGFALVNHEHVPAWLIALAPLVAIPFGASLALIANVARLRGRVIDNYERDLREILRETDRRNVVPYGHTVLDTRIWSGPIAHITLVISFLAYFAGYIATVVQCFRYSKSTEPALAIVGLVSASVSAVVLVALYAASFLSGAQLRRGLRGLAPEAQGNSVTELSDDPGSLL